MISLGDAVASELRRGFSLTPAKEEDEGRRNFGDDVGSCDARRPFGVPISGIVADRPRVPPSSKLPSNEDRLGGMTICPMGPVSMSTPPSVSPPLGTSSSCGWEGSSFERGGND